MRELRYVPNKAPKKVKGIGQGRYRDPSQWITGPCPIRRDKYYAWLKHRAQANFRGEHYSLSWEAFEMLWYDDDVWFQRGRRSDSLCMSLIDWRLGWIDGNVEVIPRIDQLRKPKHND